MNFWLWIVLTVVVTPPLTWAVAVVLARLLKKPLQLLLDRLR